MKNIVGMAISFALTLAIMQGAVSADNVSKTQVYIENGDDDSLWVKFYLDGKFGGSTKMLRDTTKRVALYRLSAGTHELKLEWSDPDECGWQERTKTVEATGEDMNVTLSVIPTNESECKKAAAAKEAVIYTTLDVSVKNNDDDTLFVRVYIDGYAKRGRTVGSHYTYQFRNIPNTGPGYYTVTVRWMEPDSMIWYEKTQEIEAVEGKNNVTFETDEIISELSRPNSSIKIYVENVDDDELMVDLYVDSRYAVKKVRSGTTRHFGRFANLHSGTHTVKVRWIDPDVLGWHERKFIVELKRDEELSKTIQTIKNTG